MEQEYKQERWNDFDTKVATYFNEQTCPKGINDVIRALRCGVNLKLPVILREMVRAGALICVYGTGEDRLYVSSEVLNRPVEATVPESLKPDVKSELLNKKRIEDDERYRLELARKDRQDKINQAVNRIEAAWDQTSSPAFPSFVSRDSTSRFTDLRAQSDVLTMIAAKSMSAVKSVSEMVDAVNRDFTELHYHGTQKYREIKQIATAILESYTNFKEPESIDVYSMASINEALAFVNELNRWCEHYSDKASRLMGIFKNKVKSQGQYEESQKSKWTESEGSALSPD